MAELQFRESAAAGYDRSVGEMTRRIVPLLLRAARLAPGMRVLDIATGTGIAAEAAAEWFIRQVMRPWAGVLCRAVGAGDDAVSFPR